LSAPRPRSLIETLTCTGLTFKESLAPIIPVDFVYCDLEAIRIVTEALELKLSLFCGICLARATVDADKLVIGIVLIGAAFDRPAMPKQIGLTHSSARLFCTYRLAGKWPDLQWVRSGKALTEQMSSGSPPKADVDRRGWHIRLGPGADIPHDT
jgi:hypothetical protein